MNNPIPPLPFSSYSNIDSFFICRDPNAVIFQNEIEPITGLMPGDNEVFNFYPVIDRIPGNMNENVLEKRIGKISSLSVQKRTETDPDVKAGYADLSACWTLSHTGGEIPRFLYDSVRNNCRFKFIASTSIW